MSGAHAETPSTAAPGRLVVLAFLLAMTALSAARQGYGFSYKNQAYQLPVVLGMTHDPSFADDPFVRSLDAYTSPFLGGVGLLVQWAPVAPTFFVLFLIVRFALLASLARLAWVASGDRRVAALVVLFGVARFDGLAGSETLFWHYASHTAAAYPLLLLSFSFLIEGRIAASAIAGAAAAYANPLTAAYALSTFALAWLAGAAPRGAPRWRDFARWAGIVAGLAVPLAASVLSHARGGTSAPDWVPLARTLLPFHLVPTRFGATEWAKTLGFALLALVLARRARENPRLQMLSAIVPAACVLTFAGWLFAEVWPIRLAMQLHLPRALALVTVVAEILVARYLIVELRERGGAAWIGIAVAAALIDSTKMLLVAWIPIGIDWLAERGFSLQPRGRARTVSLAAAVAAAGASLALYVAKGAPESSRWLGGLALAFTPLVYWVSAPARRPAVATIARGGPSQPPIVLVASACAIVLALGLALTRAIREVPARGLIEPRDPWSEVQRWAARATPPGSLFLTPPTLAGFRSLSRRSSYVDMKDGCAILWDPPYAEEWLRRVALLGVGREAALGGDLEVLAAALEGAFRKLDAGSLERFAAEEGVDFVVTDREQEDALRARLSEIPVVHENKRFVVRDVRGFAEGG